MAIEIISAEDVLAGGGKNKAKVYPVKGRDAHRLVPFADVAHTPKFKFSSDAKIFTAGSCFARNVEKSLVRSGYDVLSSRDTFYNPFPDRVAFQRYNKYTIASILNEIEWALGEKPMDSEALLCEVRPDQFCDLQTSGDSLRTNLDEMVKFRETFNKCFEPVKDADVVILTLGLVECWYDNTTGVHLNRFPGAHAVKNNPGRFSMHVLDYDEIYSSLVKTYETIAKHNSDFQMLVTVSPVPLDRTFRGSDVLVANAYSKSVQRAAVEAFVKNYPADYFPSYEIVTLSDLKYAWSDKDFRHVRTDIVDRIMGGVLEQYTDVDSKQSAQKTRGYLTAYLQAGDLKNAERVLNEHIEKFGLSIGLQLQAADLSFRKGEVKEAADILRNMLAAMEADKEKAHDELEGRIGMARNNAGSMLEQCQRYLDQPGKVAGADMDRNRAAAIVQSQRNQDPANDDLVWLQDYLDRASAGSAEAVEKEKDKDFLREASAIARFRVASRAGEIEQAEDIAKRATDELGFSELMQWELGVMYRYNDRPDEAFVAFEKIARFGGLKAVPAIKNAMRIAHKIGKEEQIADLADLVLEQIAT